jgi:hypothetical protein
MSITVSELRIKHPMPWVYKTTGPGRVQVFDAAGVEVMLFTILDFTVAITQHLANQPPSTPAPSV